MSVRLTYLKDNGYALDNGDIKHTKVTTFCLPMLGTLTKEFGKDIINVHIDDKNNLYLVVLNSKNKQVEELLSKLSEHECFLESYDDDDGKELVFKFKVPEKHLNDYHAILDGKYSEISREYKELLTSDKYYKVTYFPLNEPPVIINGQVATTMWETLYPSIKKKEVVAKHFGVEVSSVLELMAKPDLKYELYRKTEQLNTVING